MKVTISFDLIDKKIGDDNVAGLVALAFDPPANAIVKKTLMMIESMADPKPVVGFVDANSINLFKACDWLIGGTYGDQHLVASDAVDEEKFDGKVW